METIAVIGFLIFVVTLFYLVYHFIKKIKQPDRIFSKKLVYPLLIGGVLLFFIGLEASDTSVQDELNSTLELNDELISSAKELQSTVVNLEHENEQLLSQQGDANKELESLSAKVSKLEKIEEELEQIELDFKEENDDLRAENIDMEQQIQELEVENQELESNVASLNQQLTSSKNISASAPNSSSSSGSSNSSDSNTSSNNNSSVSGGSQTNFKNCTELKKVHPGGVPKGHPAYQDKMDRDKDGWACE